MGLIVFRSKRDKDYLLEKAEKIEEYASMIVDCIKESKEHDEYDERYYRGNEDDMMEMNNRMSGRYGYRRSMMR